MKKTLILLLLLPHLFFAQRKEIAFRTFTLLPSVCKGFQTSSGSLLFIPSSAFVKENGEDCNGVVTLKYREFHSQTDMFYGNINMIYDDNSKYRILESAGMFEIEAWCGNQKLKLREGKSIQVRMKTRRNLDSLFSFIYNRTKRTWSKYSAKVMDFSFFKNKNNADSTTLWGSPKVKPPEINVEIETGGVFNPNAYYGPVLPEGFFKGVDIKELGLFNYDGVIKDSLAVPVQPEFNVKINFGAYDHMICVAYESRNTLVSYTPDQLKDKFVFLKLKGIKVFISEKGEPVAVLKNNELDKVNFEDYRNKPISITLEPLPVKPKNEKELAAATGLKTE